MCRIQEMIPTLLAFLSGHCNMFFPVWKVLTCFPCLWLPRYKFIPSNGRDFVSFASDMVNALIMRDIAILSGGDASVVASGQS